MRHEPLARDDGLAAGAGRPPAGVSTPRWRWPRSSRCCSSACRPQLAASLVVAATTLGLAWLARRQIGGQTGDVLGAMQQIGEIGVLLAVLAVG